MENGISSLVKMQKYDRWIFIKKIFLQRILTGFVFRVILNWLDMTKSDILTLCIHGKASLIEEVLTVLKMPGMEQECSVRQITIP